MQLNGVVCSTRSVRFEPKTPIVAGPTGLSESHPGYIEDMQLVLHAESNDDGPGNKTFRLFIYLGCCQDLTCLQGSSQPAASTSCFKFALM